MTTTSTQPMRPPVRRGRPPRVSRETILDAVDARGDADWTMAGIASELGVSEPAIYYHFPSKQALVVALGARVLGEFQLPQPREDWEPWLEEFAHRLLAVYRGHPFLQDVDMASVVTLQPGSMHLLEDVLGYLVSCGFTLQDAVYAVHLVMTVVQQFGGTGARSSAQDAEDLRAAATAADAPLAADVYANPGLWDLDATLHGLLRVCLAGIRTELAPRRTRPGRWKRS